METSWYKLTSALKKIYYPLKKLILDLQRKKRQKPLQTPHEVKLLEITIFKKES